jgi:hypothetical protein
MKGTGGGPKGGGKWRLPKPGEVDPGHREGQFRLWRRLAELAKERKDAKKPPSPPTDLPPAA